MNKVDFKTIIKLIKYDNSIANEISNISILFQRANLAIKFLEESGSQFSRQIISTYLDSYLSPVDKQNHWTEILYFIFKNNLISDEIFKSTNQLITFSTSIEKLVTSLIACKQNIRNFEDKWEDEEIVLQRIIKNVDILKLIFKDDRFNGKNYTDSYYDSFCQAYQHNTFFVSSKHLIIMIKNLYQVERSFSGYTKENLLNLFFLKLVDPSLEIHSVKKYVSKKRKMIQA